MKKIIHRAAERGYADHGWLKSYHSFSFAGYYDPDKVHFGVLRVLNDDSVAGGAGFGLHPHDNMEIISIPTSGSLKHKDNMGNSTVIQTNDVQIMSAGTGVKHSEYNNSDSEVVKFFQIWVFPKKKNITPSYDQKTFNPIDRADKWQLIVSPDGENNSVIINQDAWFSMTKLSQGKNLEYEIKQQGNGAYIYVVEGNIELDGEKLDRRDAIGVSDFTKVNIRAIEDSEVLIMDIPMN